MGTIQKFYLHDATSPDTGTLPGASPLGHGGTATYSASGAATNRDADDTPGSSQQSPSLNTATTNAVYAWFRRFLSRPLAAQTIGAGTWSLAMAGLESNANANQSPSFYIGVWRPSTGAKVGDLTDLSAAGAEFATSETGRAWSQSGGALTIQDGDVLVFEMWSTGTPSMSTSYAITENYDGATDPQGGIATSDAASYVQAPAAITLYTPPQTYQLAASGAVVSQGSANLRNASEVRIAFASDLHYDAQVSYANAVASRITTDGADYVALGGDSVDGSTATEFTDSPNGFDPNSAHTSNMGVHWSKLLATIGNHEYDYTTNYDAYFPWQMRTVNSGGTKTTEDWHAEDVTTGAVTWRLIHLNTNVSQDSESDTQVTWAKGEIDAAVTAGKRIIIFNHWPVFSDGYHEDTVDRHYCDMHPYIDLLWQYAVGKAEAYVSGHEPDTQIYDRALWNQTADSGGLIQLNGGANTELSAFNNTPPAICLYADDATRTHLRLTLRATSLFVEAVRITDGTVLYSHTYSLLTRGPQTLSLAASGAQASSGSAVLTQIAKLGASGAAASSGSAALGRLQPLAASGAGASSGSAALAIVQGGQTYDLAASGAAASSGSAVLWQVLGLAAAGAQSTNSGFRFVSRKTSVSNILGTTLTIEVANNPGDLVVLSIVWNGGHTNVALPTNISDAGGNDWAAGSGLDMRDDNNDLGHGMHHLNSTAVCGLVTVTFDYAVVGVLTAYVVAGNHSATFDAKTFAGPGTTHADSGIAYNDSTYKNPPRPQTEFFVAEIDFEQNEALTNIGPADVSWGAQEQATLASYLIQTVSGWALVTPGGSIDAVADGAVTNWLATVLSFWDTNPTKDAVLGRIWSGGLAASGAVVSQGSADLIIVPAGPQTYPLAASGAASSTGSAVLVAIVRLAASGAGASSGSAGWGPWIMAIAAAGAATRTGDANIGRLWAAALAAVGAGASSGSANLAIIPAGPQTWPIAASGAAASSGSAAIGRIWAAALAATGAQSSTGTAILVAIRVLGASGTAASSGTAVLVRFAALAALGVAVSSGSATLVRIWAAALFAAGAGVSAGSADLQQSGVQDLAASGAAVSIGYAHFARLYLHLDVDSVRPVSGFDSGRPVRSLVETVRGIYSK